jgi:hypothetical protein
MSGRVFETPAVGFGCDLNHQIFFTRIKLYFLIWVTILLWSSCCCILLYWCRNELYAERRSVNENRLGRDVYFLGHPIRRTCNASHRPHPPVVPHMVVHVSSFALCASYQLRLAFPNRSNQFKDSALKGKQSAARCFTEGYSRGTRNTDRDFHLNAADVLTSNCNQRCWEPSWSRVLLQKAQSLIWSWNVSPYGARRIHDRPFTRAHHTAVSKAPSFLYTFNAHIDIFQRLRLDICVCGLEVEFSTYTLSLP